MTYPWGRKPISQEEARRLIAESNQRTLMIRKHDVVPTAVRVEDAGGGVFSVRVIDTKGKAATREPTDSAKNEK